jgi:hypothetical protein
MTCAVALRRKLGAYWPYPESCGLAGMEPGGAGSAGAQVPGKTEGCGKKRGGSSEQGHWDFGYRELYLDLDLGLTCCLFCTFFPLSFRCAGLDQRPGGSLGPIYWASGLCRKPA